MLDETAAGLGLSCTKYPDPDGVFADHRVFATAATTDEDATPALVGHVDTVFPRELGFLAFERSPADGDTIAGPGTLDMKSGLSVIFFALGALRKACPEGYGRLKVRVIINSDEEVGSPSSAPMLAMLAPKLTEALVFEAGRVEDQIVTARKGGGMFKITARGTAAHAGNNHAEGVSAIHGLALLIPKIEAMTDYDRGVTLNVGLIDGGTAKNTVPETASCVVDARFLTKRDADRVVAEIHALVAAPWSSGSPVPARLTNLKFSVSGGVTRPPMEATADSQALRQRYENHAHAVGLKIGEAPLQGGGSDANLLAAAGVPSIDGLGPFGRHFHKVQEWSSLSSLRRRTKALARYLASRTDP